jgi:hypothetical protein
LQNYVVYSIGTGTAASDANATKALVSFFSNSVSVSAMKANGLEPVAP